MDLLISVIVVTYNRAHFLKEALESIQKQTFKDYEVILVDDGSTDDTKEIAEKYEGIRYIYQEHNGISKARNTAVKAARGKWVAFLDSDDLWEKDKLQKQVDYLHAHPDCRIVFTLFRNFTDIPEDKLDRRQQDLLQTVIDWCLPTALIDRSLFDEIGLFDEAMEYSEDTDWVFRLKFCKINVEHCVDEVLYLRRVHSSNISNARKEITHEDMLKLVLDAYRKLRRLRKK
jgi:glycosyltransferase involved in cell wall biosynthesis